MWNNCTINEFINYITNILVKINSMTSYSAINNNNNKYNYLIYNLIKNKMYIFFNLLLFNLVYYKQFPTKIIIVINYL